jgi:CRP-like cAMP-binding protein
MHMQTPSAGQLLVFREQLLKFVTFTDEQWALFSEHLYLKQLRKKELFVPAGKVCSEIGFMLSGSTRIFFVKDGIEISSYFCFELDLITSYASFLKRQPSLVSIEAMEDSALICFSCEGLHRMMEDPRLVFPLEHMGRLIAEYLICCYEERVMSFLSQSPEERYRYILQSAPGLLQRIPQHHIANYLGVTPVSLSRIRKRIVTGKASGRSALSA